MNHKGLGHIDLNFFSRIATLVNKEYNQNCQNFAVNTDVEHLKFLYMIVFFGQLNILEK